MAKQTNKRYSKEFGKKEKVLNYATQTYQLSRPNKVGAVMALIRECQPKTIEEWEKWYFENATTDGKAPSKITKESLEELGERSMLKSKKLLFPNGQKHLTNLHYRTVLTTFIILQSTEHLTDL